MQVRFCISPQPILTVPWPSDQSEFLKIQTDREVNSVEAGKKRIWIRGQYVEVTDEVYMAYTQGDRKRRYLENDLKTERFVL